MLLVTRFVREKLQFDTKNVRHGDCQSMPSLVLFGIFTTIFIGDELRDTCQPCLLLHNDSSGVLFIIIIFFGESKKNYVCTLRVLLEYASQPQLQKATLEATLPGKKTSIFRRDGEVKHV